MSPIFNGGPLAGQVGYSQQAGDPSPDALRAGIEAGPQEEEGQEMSSSAKFNRLIADARALAASDGDFSEEDKLIIEQVTTLLQKLKAKGEKDVATALSGRMSPAVGKAYAGVG